MEPHNGVLPQKDMGPETKVSTPRRDMGPESEVCPSPKGPGTRVWKRDWEPDWGTPPPHLVVVDKLKTLPWPIVRIRAVIIQHDF